MQGTGNGDGIRKKDGTVGGTGSHRPRAKSSIGQ